MKSWPKTSDKEFSKRVCRTFMFAYFVHIVVTIVVAVFWPVASKSVLDVFTISQPAYMLVFGAVIAKSGVENVFKGKAQSKDASEGTENG